MKKICPLNDKTVFCFSARRVTWVGEVTPGPTAVEVTWVDVTLSNVYWGSVTRGDVIVFSLWVLGRTTSVDKQAVPSVNSPAKFSFPPSVLSLKFVTFGIDGYEFSNTCRSRHFMIQSDVEVI